MKQKITIGELIENEVHEQRIPVTKFAKAICCQRNNVYDIFQRHDIGITQLKLISKVLQRNFFKDLAKDIDLIDDGEDSAEEQKAVSQFFDVVPDVLQKLGKSSTIVFSKLDDTEYADCPTPDFGLTDHFITFTIGETLKERIGDCATLPIESVSNDDGCTVEVCTNAVYGSVCVNVKVDYKTAEEWHNILAFAFETYTNFVRK